MPKTRINCPNCRQMVIADIEQLLDVGTDPAIKQRFLSGAINVIACPACGYQGGVATPLVYHDPNKELLLTYFPAEIGLPVNEQEKTIGPLIKKVTDSLPAEKRKAYLFQPQTMFTMQTMIERILEGDGITKEMIEAQQRRMALLQKLLTSSDAQFAELVRTEEALLDGEFFTLLARIHDTVQAGGDLGSADKLSELQKKLLPITNFGQKILEQEKEVETAVQALQKIGKELTPEKLLDLVLKTPNDIQLRVIVGFTRPAMDYYFFQLLSQKIEQVSGAEQARLLELRVNLYNMTREIDQHVEANLNRGRTLLNTILQSSNITETTLNNFASIDDYFIQVFSEAREEARKKADLEKINKLNQIEGVLNKASTPPKEISLIEELLDAPDEKSIREMLQQHQSEITPEFMNILTNLVSQIQGGENVDLSNHIQMLYRLALQTSMQANL